MEEFDVAFQPCRFSQVIQHNCPAAMLTPLLPGDDDSCFWSARHTINSLKCSTYFKSNDGAIGEDTEYWPEPLKDADLLDNESIMEVALTTQLYQLCLRTS